MLEERNITISLEKAKEWFNSGNNSLREIALQAFTEKELTYKPFKEITSFKKAVDALGLDYWEIHSICKEMAKVSRASAAMFKLNLVRKALHLGYEIDLINGVGDFNTWYPYNPFIAENSTAYHDDLKAGRLEIVGTIHSGGILYNILGGTVYCSGNTGYGNYHSDLLVGTADADIAFLGCANREIAEHFGKHFGILITVAKFGDIKDFKVVK